MSDVSHVNGSIVKGIPQTANYGSLNNKDNVINAGVHETLHFFGFSDRYNDFSGDNDGFGKVPHIDFENDLMGNSGGSEFKNVHFENVLNFAKGNSNSKKGSTNGFDYITNNKKYIDSDRKTSLKNGDKQNTYYHRNSKQAQ